MAKSLLLDFIVASIIFALSQYPSDIVRKEKGPVPSHPKCENGFL